MSTKTNSQYDFAFSYPKLAIFYYHGGKSDLSIYITIYYNYPITIDIGISSSNLSHKDDRHTLCTGR